MRKFAAWMMAAAIAGPAWAGGVDQGGTGFDGRGSATALAATPATPLLPAVEDLVHRLADLVLPRPVFLGLQFLDCMFDDCVGIALFVAGHSGLDVSQNTSRLLGSTFLRLR